MSHPTSLRPSLRSSDITYHFLSSGGKGKRWSQPSLMSVNSKQSNKRLQKNCIKCTQAHLCCVYASSDDNSCTRCRKRCLQCVFRISSKSSISFHGIHHTVLSQFELTQHLSFYLPSPEQGRRNDLSRDVAVRKNPSSVVAMSNIIRPRDIHHLSPPVTFISDSVHCSPLTQFSGSNGRSCHTDEKISVELDDVTSGVVPNCQDLLLLPPHGFTSSPSPVLQAPFVPRLQPEHTWMQHPPKYFIKDSDVRSGKEKILKDC
jgi:hypothetical protein